MLLPHPAIFFRITTHGFRDTGMQIHPLLREVRGISLYLYYCYVVGSLDIYFIFGELVLGRYNGDVAPRVTSGDLDTLKGNCSEGKISETGRL